MELFSFIEVVYIIMKIIKNQFGNYLKYFNYYFFAVNL